jgi:pimeloyl-ACP methyl ester carboxylesterase
MTIERFTVDVSQKILQDLRERLSRARFADDYANDSWAYGVNGAYLAELTRYWRDEYDWRHTEREINSFSHFRTVIDEVPIHFIHERGKGPNPVPIILNHGWPWTFWDFKKVIGPLTNPTTHGGDAADAFDVIVPSLPGFGFSTPLRKPGVNFWNTADLWVKLMDALGYQRFATQGGDWGAMLSMQLGHKYADRLLGLHLELAVPLDMFEGVSIPREDYAPDEHALLQHNETFFAEESGYIGVHTTKPQSLAFGLNDSPIGLLAWILEKRRTWSDCNGNVETRFTKDEILDTVMIYWVTQSIGTSLRYYYEAAHDLWAPLRRETRLVEAPTAFLHMPGEILQPPRAWLERTFNLKRFTRLTSGGHFGPMEEPEELIRDVRQFFSDLRVAS